VILIDKTIKKQSIGHLTFTANAVEKQSLGQTAKTTKQW
jgi:hypothetical protein